MSKPCWVGLMIWLRDLRRVVARRFMRPLVRPIIRRDQGRPTWVIIGWVAKEKIRPPMPLPALVMPLAKLLLWIIELVLIALWMSLESNWAQDNVFEVIPYNRMSRFMNQLH